MTKTLLVAWISWCSLAVFAASSSQSTNNVTDESGKLSAEDLAAIERSISEIRDSKDIWMAVVLPSSLGQDTIEQFAERYFRQGEFGEKGKDNGLLLVIALNERRTRLEVGYGLEGVLPDALTRRLLDQRLGPLLKEGEIRKGIISLIDGLPDARAEQSPGEVVAPAQEPVAWILEWTSPGRLMILGRVLGVLFFFYQLFSSIEFHNLTRFYYWRAFEETGSEPSLKLVTRRSGVLRGAAGVAFMTYYQFVFSVPAMDGWGPVPFVVGFVASGLFGSIAFLFLVFLPLYILFDGLAQKRRKIVEEKFPAAFDARVHRNIDERRRISGSSSGGSSSSSSSGSSSSSSGGGRSGGGGSSSSF